MKFKHLAGIYYIKIKGRGITKAQLTKRQADVLFELLEKGLMELESLTHENYK